MAQSPVKPRRNQRSLHEERDFACLLMRLNANEGMQMIFELSQGYVIYRGPSVLDGSPIVAILTGLISPARNDKTGPIPQIYVIRADVNPMKAAQTGEDAAVCGDCELRGRIIENKGVRKNVERGCYVTLMHGPRVVYDSFSRGVYPDIPPQIAQKVLRRRKVRLGAYGDPAAVPFPIWEVVLGKVEQLTGYTSQWRRFPELSAFCMASVRTEAEREAAKALGFRTYRVRRQGEPVLKGEGQCPGSDEMGKAVRCIDCMLCDGQRRSLKHDIVVQPHGNGAKYFNPEQVSIHA